jgi:GTP-binding protein
VKKNQEQEEEIVNSWDMIKHGMMILVASGGKPGLGNGVFRGNKNSESKKSVPTTKMPGDAGEERSFLIELKLIADVGLVGFPNVR